MPAVSLFSKIDHVGIAVPDLDAAIAFYRDTFGIVSVHEEVNEEQGVREAMLAVGDGATRIQLLAPLNDASTIAKFIDRNGPGVQQVAYTVTDIDAGRFSGNELDLTPGTYVVVCNEPGHYAAGMWAVITVQ